MGGRSLAVAAAVASLGACGTAVAAPPELPVTGAEVARGTLAVSAGPADRAAASIARRADGRLSDWVGARTGFAGAATYSRGEYVYEDHIWDSYGASSADGAARTAALDALAAADPDAYRAEAVTLYLPNSTAYGAGPIRYEADLTELRLAAGDDTVSVLARTTLMTDDDQPGVLLLADTRPGTAPLPVPFGSGLTTRRADVALLLARGRGTAVDLATGERHTFPVAVDAAGYANAIEAEIPRSLVASGDRIRVAAATGALDPQTGELAGIANVAFRHEPVRPVFDKLQAAALHAGTIDAFFADVDITRLRQGATSAVTPLPGYHDRITVSDERLSRERLNEGTLQHYGLYLPPGYAGERPAPATFFLHGSGNDAHDLPSVLPGLVRALGDARGGVVIAPQGRTDLSLWIGAGLEDVHEVWADAARTVRIDPRRTAIAGYSMGGLGAFLLSALYPDRFATSFAIAGPVGGDVWSPGVLLNGLPDVRRVFANLRGVPTAIYQGAADNNVPITNGRAAANALDGFGYRYRLFEFPGDNHFSPGVVDRWEPALEYLRSFPPVDPNPAAVTFVRDMALERDVNRARFSDQERFPPGGHAFRFDGAYWVDGLTAADEQDGVARIDVRSLAIPERRVRSTGELGAGASPDPFVWSGRAWSRGGAASVRANRFTASLTGASAVALDIRRMRLDARRTIRGTVVTEHPLELELAGLAASGGRRSTVLRLHAGTNALTIPPGR